MERGGKDRPHHAVAGLDPVGLLAQIDVAVAERLDAVDQHLQQVVVHEGMKEAGGKAKSAGCT